MKRKLLEAAVKAAPRVLGTAPTTRDLRGAAMERAARWAAEQVATRAGKGAKAAGKEAGTAAEKMRAKLRRAAPAPSSRGAGYAAKGLAAAALTLPLGLWVGSRLRSRV